MRKTRNILLAVFISVIISALVIVIVCETDLVGVGVWAEKTSEEFALTSLMELVSLAAIPLSLRLFKFAKVRNSLVAGRKTALLKWGVVRILSLGVPLLVNTVLYYLFMSTTFGYMSIILLLCMSFVFPAMSKCYYEISTDN